MRHSFVIVAGLAITAATAPAQQTWYVAAGATGTGALTAPFGKIQQGVQAAQPGDTVLIAPGTYVEQIATVRAGAPGNPIVIKATKGRGSVVVTRAGQVLQIGHPDVHVEGLVVDAQYAASDAVKVSSSGDRLVLRDVEVRRSARDCIDMAAPEGVRIEDSLVHRCLWWNGARQDAHGIVAGSVRGLRIRNVQIHTFSGDAIQLDPGRSLPGWDDVVIENSTMSLRPLDAAEAGFAAGVVPGENAIDTKVNGTAPRATLKVTNTVASGFRNGLIANMAAFNIKENVDAILDGVTVHASTIAFRLRGPGSNGGAWVRLQNAVVHDVSTAIRYEDDIEQLKVAHVTFGTGIGRAFQAASSGWAGVDVRNSAFVGSSLPTEAPADGHNALASVGAFVAAGTHDYRLAAGSALLDKGMAIADVTTDRVGAPRRQGSAPDIGAYERPVTASALALSGAPLSTDPTNSARLSWTSVSGQTGYELERSADGQTFARITTRAADKTSYNNGPLVSGRTYWYRVRPVTSAGPQSYSNVVAVALHAEGSVPAAPRTLTATLSTSSPSTAVVLGWEDASLNEDGFIVERSTDGVAFTKVGTRGVNERSCTSSGLTSRTLYYYRVRAHNSLGVGAPSNVVSIRTQ